MHILYRVESTLFVISVDCLLHRFDIASQSESKPSLWPERVKQVASLSVISHWQKLVSR